jgi:predicted nucleotidyltransferase component of viral defense system
MRMALEQRLRNEADATGIALMRLRKRVAFERLLARLASSPGEWVLKGAFALELRLGLRTRTTKDVDLARDDDEVTVTRDLATAAALDLGDHFNFRVRRTSDLERVVDVRAVRYVVTGDLAGRLFEQFPLDAALVEAPALAPDVISIDGSLAFAGVGVPPLAVIAIEQHVAEKVHAYVSRYGDEQRRSTRVKDLVDLVLIARHSSPGAERLGQALGTTFERSRKTAMPDKLPPPPRDWTVPYAQLAAEVGLPSDLAAAHAEAGALLDPVLRGEACGVWNANAASWQA